MVKFFTTPPKPYPYILINAYKPKFSFLKYAKEVIIDSGIEIFRNPNIKDYPKNHIYKIIRIYSKVKRIVNPKNIYVICMDYCDDYNPKALWINEEITNIERTVENVEKYTERFKWINWIPVIQGWYKKPESVLRCIKLYREKGIIDKFDYFAIGNLSIENDVEILYKTVNIVRKELPDKKLHVFSLKLNALKKVFGLIDSFDSMAWTRPVDSTVVSGKRHSCKTNEERIKFFDRWLYKFNKIISQQTLLNYFKENGGNNFR
jgi:hypothetical protein